MFEMMHACCNAPCTRDLRCCIYLRLCICLRGCLFEMLHVGDSACMLLCAVHSGSMDPFEIMSIIRYISLKTLNPRV